MNFKINYNYKNFNKEKKNIFIIGNSYADNLLNLFSNNKNLNKKYYFYTPLGDKKKSFYQIKCLKNFLLSNDLICEDNKFSFFETQFKNSDYIILAEGFSDSSYTENYFIDVIKLLNKDYNKKFLIFLDDVRGADILDTHIFKTGELPNLKELNKLEKIFFKKSMNFEKNIISKLKEQFFEYEAKYLTRSELYCNYMKKTCPLLRNNNKLYLDHGHITNNGASFFSSKGQIIIEKLIKN